MAFDDVKLRPRVHVELTETRAHTEQVAQMLIVSPVVKATSADRDEVVQICKEDHDENGQFPLSLSKLEATVSRILDKSEGVIGIIRHSTEIEAVLVLQVGQFWYSDAFCLEEVLNFVRPKYRRSTHAKNMIGFAKRCSEEIGIPLVIGVVSNERTAAKMELYKRQLGEPCGGYFLYQKRPLVTSVAANAVRA